MAPTAETVKMLRWSQEETDILRQMTNDQLELEAQDRSMMISWTSHWKKVSSRLKEHGYNRSATACRGIWKRGVGGPRTNKDAAGPDWDDTEHEILVHMTRKQLRLEQENAANEIPWTKHWEKVSLQLEEEGYNRTADNCDAYWQIVESGMEVASDLEDDDQLPEDAEDDGSPSALAVTSPQMSKVNVWSAEEYENLLELLKARRKLEEKEGLEPLEGRNLWVEIAQSHKASGYDRTFEGCKTFWNKQGRARSGFDERAKLTDPSTAHSSTATPKSNSVASKSSTPPWSTVNGAVEESVDISRNPAIEALRKFQKEQSSETPDLGYATASPTIKQSASINFEVVEFDHDMDSTPAGPGKKERKKGVTNFRLTHEQRAVLEAEVAKNGIITSERKQDLAEELDLEYKTVRNWFTNYNVKARRSQGSLPIIPTEQSMKGGDFDDSFDDNHPDHVIQLNNPITETSTPTNENVAPPIGIKRPHSAGHDGLIDSHAAPSKKARLPTVEKYVQRDFSHQREPPVLNSGFNPVNRASSHRPPIPHAQSHIPTKLPQPPVVPSTGNIAPRVNGPEFRASSQNGPTIETSPSPAQLLPAHGLQSVPSVQSTAYPNRMMFNDRDGSGIKESTGQPGEITNLSGVNGGQRQYAAATGPESSSGRTPLPSLERPLIADPRRSELPSHVPHTYPVAPAPNRLNVLLQPRPVDIARSPTLANQRPTTQGEPSISASPSVNEDEKATAYRTVQKFGSEIESLKQARAVHDSRIADIQQQLSVIARQRHDVERAKQADIARAMREIEALHAGPFAALRQQEFQLENSRNAEIDGRNKNTLELSKKEKGLVRWQGIVEFYEEGDEP